MPRLRRTWSSLDRAILQNKLGITNGCPAFDVQAVCSGFVYALTVADSMIPVGRSRACWWWARSFQPYSDFNDRTTCVLFGDGAGAGAGSSDEPGILSTELHADGSHVASAFQAMCRAAMCWVILCSRWMVRPFSSWRLVLDKAARATLEKRSNRS
ncbi:hypothetical protein J4714_13320 [Staphylococcus epidermidis]|nr:hypothetical protein [Staphylococcus epidermidis]